MPAIMAHANADVTAIADATSAVLAQPGVRPASLLCTAESSMDPIPCARMQGTVSSWRPLRGRGGVPLARLLAGHRPLAPACLLGVVDQGAEVLLEPRRTDPRGRQDRARAGVVEH